MAPAVLYFHSCLALYLCRPMPKTAAAVELARRKKLIDAIQNDGKTKNDLLEILGVHMRTLEKDLAWIRTHFPSQLLESGRPRCLRWAGQPPIILSEAPTWLGDHELLALVVARGLLRDPSKAGYSGLLSEAIDRLLHRCGLAKEAGKISPYAIEVNRFGAAPEDPAILTEVLGAVVCGDPIECEYLNLKGESSQRCILPLRACLIEGEFHLLAVDGQIAANGEPLVKDFRVSRITKVRRVQNTAPGLPTHVSQQILTNRTAAAFRSTGSQNSKDLHRVVLVVSAETYLRLKGRTFGLKQRWDDKRDVVPTSSKKLPDGWHRLAFTTSGLADCQHWILSHGDQMRVESPQAIIDWIREQANRMINTYQIE